MAPFERRKVVISEKAWRMISVFTEQHGFKLEGENSDRNEDGTYTVEFDDNFIDLLRKHLMLPGESIDAFLLRYFKTMEN